VVEVEVRVAEGVHEVAHPQAGDLRHHVRQQRVGGDVERHAEEDVGGALVQLARQPAGSAVVGRRHVELEERVARRERHGGQVGDVPGADDVAPGVGVGLQRLDDLGELVDRLAGRRRPAAPLVPVDRTELAVGVGPLVPDGDAVLAQPRGVGVATDEPEQLPDDRPEVDLLGGDEREPLGEVEAHLVPEHAERAGAGAVALLDPLVEDAADEIEVGLHDSQDTRPHDRPGRARLWACPSPSTRPRLRRSAVSPSCRSS
jgi:hypothetical protein